MLNEPIKALVIAEKSRGQKIRRELEKERIDVRWVGPLASGPAAIRRNPGDIVVLDFGVPPPAGVEVLRELKEIKVEKPELPFVLLASDKVPEPVGDFLESGVALYRGKTLNAKRLLGCVEEARKESAGQSRRGSLAAEAMTEYFVAELHDPRTGRLDAKRIARYLSIPVSSLASAAGKTIAAVHKSPAATSLQGALAPVAQVLGILSRLFRSPETVRSWLNSPHPDLGDRTPLSLIVDGKATGLLDMLHAALAGQPS